MALKGKAKSKSGSKKKNKKKNTDNDSNESGVDVDSNDNDNDDISDDISDVTASFATDYHAPVMCVECIDALLGCDRQDQPFMFVDGTLGGGGHSSALLERLGPGDVVFGCDVDSDALLRFADHLSFFSHQTRSSTFESQCCGSFFTFFTPHTVVNVPAQT